MAHKVHLFCLSYAGASAMAVYGRWKAFLPPHFRVVPLELPGHGARMMEPFLIHMEQVVEDLFPRILTVPRGDVLAVFGHSLGATVAYELAKKIYSVGEGRLRAVFVSGNRPPHIGYEGLALSDLSNDELVSHILDSGGATQELVSREALVRMFLPVLRNDYRLAENYAFEGPIIPMAPKVISLQGSEDTMVEDLHAQQWSSYAGREFSSYRFVGNHFYLNDCAAEICQLIADTFPNDQRLSHAG